MFTNKISSYYSQDKILIEAACLSTDTKPTTGVANGSKCIEMDTGKKYMFNEEDSEWEELPSSGGGGSSDFSAATVTVVGQYGETETLDVPSIVEAGTLGNPIPFILNTSPPGVTVFTVPLYKGHAMMISSDWGVSGNIVKHDEGNWIWYDITGDCTITRS